MIIDEMKWIFKFLYVQPERQKDEWEVAWAKLYEKRLQRDAEIQKIRGKRPPKQ